MNRFKSSRFSSFVTLIIILATVPLIKSTREINQELSQRHDHSFNQLHSKHSTTSHPTNETNDHFYIGVGNNPFWLKERNFTLWFHIISMIISFGILIPIGIMAYPQICIAFIGFFFGILFKSTMYFHSNLGG